MNQTPLRDPWLVAVWPGMGGVAQLAGAQLVAQLGADPRRVQSLDELSGIGHFDVRSVEVSDGLVAPLATPAGRMFAWRDPHERRDLVVFIGELQPDQDLLGYCDRVIERAQALGVTRVVTFAAMASNIAPDVDPRVMVAATTPDLLAQWQEHGASALEGGQISGANGLLLAASQARGLPAACLLGEIPFFASQIPNPKAARAVLGVFAALAGLDLSFPELDRQVVAIETQLMRHLRELQRAAESASAQPRLANAEPEDSEEAERAAVRDRIEALFAAAERDRGEAVALKQFLDSQDLFGRYEDRFLDLFRKAG